MSWRCDAVRFAYPAAPAEAVAGVTIDVPAHAFTAVIGPNGSGKSTLLRLLLGVARPDAGDVTFEGRPVADWARAELARAVGVVPQQEEMPFPLSVRELVAMGRYPHLGPWRAERAVDRAAIAAALARCDVGGLADRPVSTLSGGERQRARIARALAQEPRALALDEPTMALDIRHEMAIFELLRRLVRERVTVVVVTHNLNLAARYADHVVLLDGGRVAASGTSAEVFRRDLLERVYQWPLEVGRHAAPGPDRGAPQIIPLGGRHAAAPSTDPYHGDST